MSVILVTGGARSGKSRFAEQLARQKGGKTLYHATGVAVDGEMKKRIARHRARRPAEWGLLESPSRLSVASYAGYDVVLFDCLSAWVSNRLLEWEDRLDAAEEAILGQLNDWLNDAANAPQTIIVVTSEVGWGGVEMSPLGRAFQDALGLANQMAARRAEEVYAVLSGLPWRLK